MTVSKNTNIASQFGSTYSDLTSIDYTEVNHLSVSVLHNLRPQSPKTHEHHQGGHPPPPQERSWSAANDGGELKQNFFITKCLIEEWKSNIELTVMLTFNLPLFPFKILLQRLIFLNLSNTKAEPQLHERKTEPVWRDDQHTQAFTDFHITDLYTISTFFDKNLNIFQKDFGEIWLLLLHACHQNRKS